MTFLSPWTAMLAAAAAVPLLLLLYFLKLRRQPLFIASTLLWRKSVDDLEVNAPFQRLRRSLLLLLQLLLLLALLLAMAQPVLETDADSSVSRVILIIDRSASMNAADAGSGSDARTRLAAARDAAREVIERLGRSSGQRQMMVVAMSASPQVVCGYESRRKTLLDAIESLEPTDEHADFQAALNLAGAYSARDEQGDEPAPEVIFISDGGVGEAPDASGFNLATGALRFVGVGPAAGSDTVRNVGIVSFSARRDYDDPARVQVFARLVNVGEKPVRTNLTLRMDGEAARSQVVDLPAPTTRGPGETSVTFELLMPRTALLSVSHDAADSLPADNTAAMVLAAPPTLRIAVVHAASGPAADVPSAGADPYLLQLVDALKPASVRTMTLPAFEALDPQQVDSGALIDLVIFDRVSGQALPGVPSIMFGGAPRGVGLRPPQSEGGRRILSWDRIHPLMRYVSLDNLIYAGFGAYDLPSAAFPGAAALASGPEGPVLAVLNASGVRTRHVLVGFDLSHSNWPVHVSLPVFLQNAVDFLTLGGGRDAGLVSAPGQVLTARTLPAATSATVEGPLNFTIPAAPGSVISLPTLSRAGLYTVSGVAPPMNQVAVSMLSDVESDIRPRGSVVVNAQRREAGGIGEAAPLALWPWVIAVALALLVAEWLVYCVRRRA